MRRLHLLLSQESNAAILARQIAKIRPLEILVESPDEISLVNARMQPSLCLSRGRFGWMASLDMEEDVDLAFLVARLAAVRMLRLLVEGEEGRAAALYSWWGPSIQSEIAHAERSDERLGLHVRATYQWNEVSEGEESQGASPLSLHVETLAVEVISTPSRGMTLCASRIEGFLCQMQRALRFGRDAPDPTEAILFGPTVADPR